MAEALTAEALHYSGSCSVILDLNYKVEYVSHLFQFPDDFFSLEDRYNP